MRAPECELDADGRHFWWKHECAEGWIEGLLPLGPNHWQLVSSEPLTVSPSIWCHTCDTHGFYRGGKWEAV